MGFHHSLEDFANDVMDDIGPANVLPDQLVPEALKNDAYDIKYGLDPIIGSVRGYVSDKLFGSSADPPQEAAAMRAAIARGLWEDYKQRFVPLENRAISRIGNRALAAKEINEAGEFAGAGVDTALAMNKDQLASYGLTLSPERQAALDRRANIAKSTATVGARNVTRRAIAERDLDALGLDARGVVQAAIQDEEG